MRHTLLAGAACIALYLFVEGVRASTIAPAYAITDVGSLGGGQTTPMGINNRGDIVHWEGGYEDTFEKTPAGWKFKSRVHVWPEVEWTDRVEDMPPRKLEDE